MTITDCQNCGDPFQVTDGNSVCPSCHWIAMKDRLCQNCHYEEMVECDPEGGCLIGGYHCRYYHIDCDMMQPQYEMFIEQEQS